MPSVLTKVSFFVPCELKNYANHGGHWTGKAGYQKALRTSAHAIAMQAARSGIQWELGNSFDPKSISLEAHVWNLFDEHDGLRNACKPIVDGLVRARVIHDDAPSAGHQFLYTQIIDRTQRGVLIEVSPR